MRFYSCLSLNTSKLSHPFLLSLLFVQNRLSMFTTQRHEKLQKHASQNGNRFYAIIPRPRGFHPYIGMFPERFSHCRCEAKREPLPHLLPHLPMHPVTYPCTPSNHHTYLWLAIHIIPLSLTPTHTLSMSCRINQST